MVIMPRPGELVANISVPFFLFFVNAYWHNGTDVIVMSVFSSNLREAFGKHYSRIPKDIKIFISLIQFEVCIYPGLSKNLTYYSYEH